MPIIRTALQTDLYKPTTGQYAYLMQPTATATFSFINRTRQVRLADEISLTDLKAELDAAQAIRWQFDEIDWLGGVTVLGSRIFQPEYLDSLRRLRLPDYQLGVTDGQLDLTFDGPWHQVTHWEIPALSIINTLYNRAQLEKLTPGEQAKVIEEGHRRLECKIDALKLYPEIKITDFGARRAFSPEHHDWVVGTLARELPNQLAGSSTLWLARKHGCQPMGTYPHEADMVMSGVHCQSDQTIRDSHSIFLREWWYLYGNALAIALTDTYGSRFFFDDFTPKQAKEWRGLRQDSGDPFEFGERAIRYYRNLGIDSMTKVIVFSDGLDLETIIKLHLCFQGRILYVFGWGTNLSNDMGRRTLSLVVKATEACGHPTVKLSDNLAKALGPADQVERFKRIFGYQNTFNQEPVR